MESSIEEKMDFLVTSAGGPAQGWLALATMLRLSCSGNLALVRQFLPPSFS